MKVIALLAVIAMWLVNFAGPQSSVGGPMTLMAVAFVIMIAVGIYMSRAGHRGALGSIVNVAVALVGGFLAISLAGVILDALLIKTHFQGSLAASRGPTLYLATAGIAIFTVFGSWLPIRIIDRFR